MRPVSFALSVLAATLVISTSCAPPAAGPINPDRAVAASPSLVAEGSKVFEKIKSESKISSNSSHKAAVRRVSTRLTKVIPLPNAEWEFVVFEDKTPNAFALPGGKVGINSGMFQITKNDAGLAAVLGHEIAHVTLNHAGDRRNQGSLIAVGGLILDGVLASQGIDSGARDVAGSVYGAGANVGVMLPHSRSDELEADKLGTIYMARAGYNPQEALAMWNRFGDWRRTKGKSQGSEFLRTHPLDETRIQALESFMPQAVAEYQRR